MVTSPDSEGIWTTFVTSPPDTYLHSPQMDDLCNTTINAPDAVPREGSGSSPMPLAPQAETESGYASRVPKAGHPTLVSVCGGTGTTVEDMKAKDEGDARYMR